MIGRSLTKDTPYLPLVENTGLLFGIFVAETILACVPIIGVQTGHMDASDQIKIIAENSCKEGACPHRGRWRREVADGGGRFMLAPASHAKPLP